MLHFVIVQRKIESFVALVLRDYILGFPRVVVEWAVSWLFHPETTQGVKVFDCMSETRGEFLRVVADALSLLARSDERRFKRVQREIHMIAHTPSGLFVAKYFRPLRICDVDPRYFFDRNRANTAKLLAAALVHEATHGLLYSAGVIQTKRNYSRIERLCDVEARRFLIRVGLRDSPFSQEEGVSPKAVPWGVRLRQLRRDIGEWFSRDLAGEAAAWKSTVPKHPDPPRVEEKKCAEPDRPPSPQ